MQTEKVPSKSNDFLEQLKAAIEPFIRSIELRYEGWSRIDSPKAFREMELELAALGRQAQDDMTSVILKHRLATPGFQAKASAAARRAKKYRSGGRRQVGVRLLGGSTTRVEVEYLKPERRGARGRRRGSGKRGKGGSGLYPALAALGVAFGASPALVSEVCCQVADSDSLRSGRAALARRGIDLGHKPTLRLVNHVSRRTNTLRHDWLAQANQSELKILTGKRVVVATDGGRLRERRSRNRGRRRKDSRHRGFDAPWREPKMLVIYTIDDKGRIENEFRPVYDGTLGDCDALYEMLGAYLEALGASAAQELIVVGDGAAWIWNRTNELRERLGLRPDQMTEVIDWYHAVEVLHVIAAVPAKWSSDRRQQWLRQAKDLLFAGDISGLIQFIARQGKGRRAKAVRKHIGYFRKNHKRMQYASFEAAHTPLGSGAIESMIRRVVNLRMKGNARFWLEENAEGMLLLRSYLKAGRIDDLLDWSLATTASWWPPAKTAAPAAPVAE